MRATKEYSYRTKAFTLTASFQPGLGVLVLNLRDFINGVVYQREYGEGDIGKGIHRKLDVEDIFYALQQDQNDALDQELGREDYVWGTEIKNMAQGSSFLIRAGGYVKVTTVTKVRSETRELVSELKLEKIKDIAKDDFLDENPLRKK